MQIPLSVLLAPLAAQAVNVVLSNDDGWAEKNIRVFYDTLTSAGESVIISAPADNESGTGSSDATPGTVTSGCEFNSCPAGSPPYGSNSSNPRFNYVNSYPVTSMRYGIQTLSPKFFGGAPDIAVAGFNVGGKRSFSSQTLRYSPAISKPRLHGPHLRHSRRGNRGCPGGHPGHRLQRHLGLAGVIHHRHADLSNRLRPALHQRDHHARRLWEALSSQRHLAQRQLSHGEQ